MWDVELYEKYFTMLCSVAVLAFGQDEKISGPWGATTIRKYLEQKYGRNGISMVVDEGGMGLEKIYSKDFALPGIAEKGYLVSSWNFLLQSKFPLKL